MNVTASEKVGAGTSETTSNPAYSELIDKALEGVDLSLLEQEEVGDLFASETAEDETQDTEEETETDSEEKADSGDEETLEAKPDTAKGKSGAAKGTASEKLPGIDVVLRELDEINPAAARVVRGLQRDFGDYNTARKQLDITQNQTLEMQRQLREALSEIKNAGDEDTQGEEDPDNPLSNVKPEERDLFKRALAFELKKLGVKTQNEADIEAQAEYVAARVKENGEKLGESLGKVGENGQVEFAPDIKAKVEAVRDRLSSTRQGVTWADLHILAMHDEIVKAAAENAVEEFKKALVARNGKKIGMLRRAETVDGSVAAPTNPRLKPAKGETQEAFRRRVFDLSWAKMPSLNR